VARRAEGRVRGIPRRILAAVSVGDILVGLGAPGAPIAHPRIAADLDASPRTCSGPPTHACSALFRRWSAAANSATCSAGHRPQRLECWLVPWRGRPAFVVVAD